MGWKQALMEKWEFALMNRNYFFRFCSSWLNLSKKGYQSKKCLHHLIDRREFLWDVLCCQFSVILFTKLVESPRIEVL